MSKSVEDALTKPLREVKGDWSGGAGECPPLSFPPSQPGPQNLRTSLERFTLKFGRTLPRNHRLLRVFQKKAHSNFTRKLMINTINIFKKNRLPQKEEERVAGWESVD
jgi:hypothetical protein